MSVYNSSPFTQDRAYAQLPSTPTGVAQLYSPPSPQVVALAKYGLSQQQIRDMLSQFGDRIVHEVEISIETLRNIYNYNDHEIGVVVRAGVENIRKIVQINTARKEAEARKSSTAKPPLLMKVFSANSPQF